MLGIWMSTSAAFASKRLLSRAVDAPRLARRWFDTSLFLEPLLLRKPRATMAGLFSSPRSADPGSVPCARHGKAIGEGELC